MESHYYFTKTELATLQAKYKELRSLLSAERLIEASKPRKDIAMSPQFGYHHDRVPIVGVTKHRGRYWARIKVCVAQTEQHGLSVWATMITLIMRGGHIA
jgi:hypothetical protein